MQPHFVDILMNFLNLIIHTESLGDFRNDCINYLMQGRGYGRRSEYGLINGAVGSMYVREHFGPEMKEQVQEIVKYIRTAFQTFLPKITWMDKQTAEKAIDKLNAMKEFIAYPDEFVNKSIIDDYYKGKICLYFLIDR